MGKRLSETEIWKERWHRELSLEYKLFWKYILDNCDMIGVWAKDIGLASFQIGTDVDEVKGLELFNQDKERVCILNDGSKWWIKDFVPFQYGKVPSEKSKFHNKILFLLKNGGFSVPGWTDLDRVSTGCQRGVHTHKDKDKDKNKDKDKDKDTKEGVIRGRFSPPTVDEVSTYCQERKNNIVPQQFVDFYASKGWKIGKEGMKDWKAAVRTWEGRVKVAPITNRAAFTKHQQASIASMARLEERLEKEKHDNASI